MGKTYKDQKKYDLKSKQRATKSYECPVCDGRHDHQLGWVKGVYCNQCGSTMVEVMRIK